jgi:hypothetical protein
MLRKLIFAFVAAAAFSTAVLSPTSASAWHGRGHGWGHSHWGHSHWAHSWGYSGLGHRGWGHHGWRHGRR